jgi:branched-chain amino acid transport system substrate-binding protein
MSAPKTVSAFARLLLVVLASSLAAPAVKAADLHKDTLKIGLMFGLTGPASPIGPVQRDGALLAIEEVNAQGGLAVGKKKVKVTYVLKDDETKPDVAIRRFRELVDEEKIDLLVGQTFAPIAAALNKEVKKTPIAYFPACVVALGMFKKEEMAPHTFSMLGSAYSIGYASASYIVQNLGLKKVVFFGPAYAFGQDQWRGAQAAFEKLGVKAEYLESPVGTADFTPYLTKIADMKPEVVMLAHWGVDAINVLKQSYETGLKAKTRIWFDWMTNVFGSGVPPEALEGVYSLMSWYYDLSEFPDKEVAAASKAFTDKFRKAYGTPPDPYAAVAYMLTKEALRAVSLAGSADPDAVAKALKGSPAFDSVKGKGTWRVDHVPVFKYNALVVIGKAAKARQGDKYDLVKVVGAFTKEDYLPSLKTLGYE